MKERFLDVIKWGLILIMAGTVFYVVYPKYEFSFNASGVAMSRCNKITGSVGVWNMVQKRYAPMSEVKSPWDK
jgi:hypothetical protein